MFCSVTEYGFNDFVDLFQLQTFGLASFFSTLTVNCNTLGLKNGRA